MVNITVSTGVYSSSSGGCSGRQVIDIATAAHAATGCSVTVGISKNDSIFVINVVVTAADWSFAVSRTR